MYRMLPSKLQASENVADDLQGFLNLLGLRWPSEPTCATVTGIILVLTRGLKEAMDMSPREKNAFLVMVKERLQGQRNFVAIDGSLKQLPKDPSQLMQDKPLLYAAAYRDDSPLPLKCDHLSFLRLVSSVSNCWFFCSPFFGWRRRLLAFQETLA